MFSTQITTMRDFESEWFRRWRDRLSLGDRIHRKAWEIAIVAETLESNGMIEESKNGVGFGVGCEPLVTFLASQTNRILATDLLPSNWRTTHCGFGDLLTNPKVDTRIVDMNWINGDGGHESVEAEKYDFSWSICSMDHCGRAWWTKRFLLNQMNCIRVGGIGVHTAEYSVNVGMPREGATIWLDRDDVVDIAELAMQLGYEMAPIDWFMGDTYHDHGIDCYPYDGQVHIKAEAHGRWGTCIVFALKKKQPGVFWLPVEEPEARVAIANVHRFHSQT